MINKAIGFIARIAIGKQLVAGIAWVHNALDGHRSQIGISLSLLVYALKLAGIIPEATANTIEIALGAIIPVTLADKVAKAKAAIDSVVPPAPANDTVEPTQPG